MTRQDTGVGAGWVKLEGFCGTYWASKGSLGFSIGVGHRRIDAFELWCWRRLLRVLWTARRSNLSILKESTLTIHWKVKVKLLSCVRLFATPRTVAYQAPQSMGFSRQEYWSGLPFPSPGDLPNPGIEPRSPAL